MVWSVGEILVYLFCDDGLGLDPIPISAICASLGGTGVLLSLEPVVVGTTKQLESKKPRLTRRPAEAYTKMERAKRLELNDLQTQQSQYVTDTASHTSMDTATVTPGLELAEIITAWTKLPPEIRTSVLTLIRMSKLDAT
jgi:hypothetical protein